MNLPPLQTNGNNRQRLLYTRCIEESRTVSCTLALAVKSLGENRIGLQRKLGSRIRSMKYTSHALYIFPPPPSRRILAEDSRLLPLGLSSVYHLRASGGLAASGAKEGRKRDELLPRIINSWALRALRSLRSHTLPALACAGWSKNAETAARK